MIDIFMACAVVVLMAYPLTGNAVHEILGVAMACLILAHNLLNLAWYRRSWNGNAMARTNAGVNLLLLLNIVLVLPSGVLISHTLFAWLNVGELWTARDIHVAAGCWFLVATSIHLGIHWRRALPAARKVGAWFMGPRMIRCSRLVGFAVVAAGMTEFVRGDLVPRMAMRELFGDFVPGQSWGRVLFRQASVIGAFAILSSLVVAWLRRRSGSDSAPNSRRGGGGGYDLDPRRMS